MYKNFCKSVIFLVHVNNAVGLAGAGAGSCLCFVLFVVQCRRRNKIINTHATLHFSRAEITVIIDDDRTTLDKRFWTILCLTLVKKRFFLFLKCDIFGVWFVCVVTALVYIFIPKNVRIYNLAGKKQQAGIDTQSRYIAKKTSTLRKTWFSIFWHGN